MKINRNILLAALGLASVVSASAAAPQEVVYVTGSTAARGAFYNTVANGTTGIFTAAPAIIAYGSTAATASKATFMEFYGTDAHTGQTLLITTDWSGSEAGIQDVSGTGTEGFNVDDSTAFGAAGSVTTPGTQPATVQHTVDIAQADNAKNFSKEPSTTAASAYDNLAIPFVFVRTTANSAPFAADLPSFNNITTDSFQNLANGGDQLPLFTGNNADAGFFAYLAGRDDNSGTRVNTFGITGFGITSLPNQIELSSGQLVAINDPTLPSPYYTTEGQSSGGTLAKSLGDTSATADLIQDPTGATVGLIAVAYLGLSDAGTATAAPYNAVQLSYNGVAYSTTAVEEGTYTFWGREYTFLRNAPSAPATWVNGKVIASLKNNTSGFEISQSLLHVTRSGPTTPPTY
jgi:hypothetical protein